MTVRMVTEEATPVSVGNTTVTPRSQAVVVDLPFAHFVWNRPTEVVVERDGLTSRASVVDITRVLQLCLYGLAFAFAIATVVARARRGADEVA